MNYDLFLQLFKYKATKNVSPLENYLIELFSYILKMLITKKNLVVKDLFNNLFSIPFEIDDFNNTYIETQCEYWVNEYKHRARPDIKIKVNNDIYFIECKVDSDLNQYKDIDQIQLYEKIKLETKNLKPQIRTLTKYEVFTKSKKFDPNNHKVFWRQIFELFKQEKYKLNKDEIILNFLCFLEENNMGGKKPLAMKKIELDNYYSLYSFLYENLSNFAIGNGYTKSAVIFDGNEDYFGFDIQYNKHPYIWFGCFKTDPQVIVVQTCIKNYNKLIENLSLKGIDCNNISYASYNKEPIFAKINISEILNGKTLEKQEMIFKNWLEKNSIGMILKESYQIEKR
ncbi:MAG: hypothetical protein J6U56_08595 [Spirochaetia bacterium]|nr:hypothetical protein [Spirochaetia bacterium]